MDEKAIDIWITIYPSVLNALDEYAKDYGYKRSELFRQIFRDWLEDRQKEQMEYTRIMNKSKQKKNELSTS